MSDTTKYKNGWRDMESAPYATDILVLTKNENRVVAYRDINDNWFVSHYHFGFTPDRKAWQPLPPTEM